MLALRNRHFFLIDLALLSAAAVLSFVLRLDLPGMQRYGQGLVIFVALAVPVQLIVFWRMGLYRRYWRYASVDELLLIATTVAVSAALVAALLFGLVLPLTGIDCPRSIPFINGMLVLAAAGGPRFATRLSGRRAQRAQRARKPVTAQRVLVAGAGDAGSMIVQEMQDNPQLGLLPIGFVDDDRRKQGVKIHGLPVLGGCDAIPDIVYEREVTEVIIAMPTAPGRVIRQILDVCSRAGVPARTVPGIYDILSGQAQVSQIREVKIEDLLRRDTVQTDTAEVRSLLQGRRVLVTGAGGSIGSELCRQIARCQPAELVLLGHGENSIYAIHNELTAISKQQAATPHPQSPTSNIQYPISNIVPIIADIRDLGRLRHVFAAYRPEVVFHAAAHKHVPLMEGNVSEAVTNNVLGTANVLCAAEEAGVRRLVAISTDKAVNPTSVMGVTKRVAELLVQASAERTGSAFVSVRFGNVLGSRGSVIPLFRQQIAAGGPVTVTHPDVRRYFMTIPEAVQLVLQAGTLGNCGEVFVLDMGEPLRIADLARDLIELSGLEVGRDIDIVYTGLRPGEKLFEELFLVGEGYGRTCHEKVFVARNGHYTSAFLADLDRMAAELIASARACDDLDVHALLHTLVPEYHLAEGGASGPATLHAPVEGSGHRVAPVQPGNEVSSSAYAPTLS